MITIDELRRKYPNPKSAGHSNLENLREGDYCIGGAFCLEMGLRPLSNKSFFYNSTCLADAIQKANDKITFQQARLFACAIQCCNDDYYKDEAWGLLEMALNYGK